MSLILNEINIFYGFDKNRYFGSLLEKWRFMTQKCTLVHPIFPEQKLKKQVFFTESTKT